MSKTFYATVNHEIHVDLDESKFTESFMEEFRRNFYDFQTIEDHAKHLAQLYTRGLVSSMSDFIEGYGNPNDMGIKFGFECVEVEL